MTKDEDAPCNYYQLLHLDTKTKPKDVAAIRAALEARFEVWKRTGTQGSQTARYESDLGRKLKGRLEASLDGRAENVALWERHQRLAILAEREEETRRLNTLKLFRDVWEEKEVTEETVALLAKQLSMPKPDVVKGLKSLKIGVRKGEAKPPPSTLERMERSAERRVFEALERLGHDGLYDFLNADIPPKAASTAVLKPSSTLADLKTRATDIQRHYTRDKRDDQKKSLAAEAITIFSSAADKEKYETSASLRQLGPVSGIIAAVGKKGYIHTRQRDTLIRKSVRESGLSKKLVTAFVEDEIARQELTLVGDEAPADREDLICCPYCGTFNPEQADTCAKCKNGFFAACINCGRKGRNDSPTCAGCGLDRHRDLQIRGLMASATIAKGRGDLAEALADLEAAALLAPDNADLPRQITSVRGEQKTARKSVDEIETLSREGRHIAVRNAVKSRSDTVPPKVATRLLGAAERGIRSAEGHVEAMRRAERAGDRKATRAALADALADCADHPDALAARERLLIQSPTGLAARQEGSTLVLSWSTPGEAPPGGWRVIRSADGLPKGPEDGASIEEDAQSPWRDRAAPGGRPLYYGVFAQREDGSAIRDKGATCGPVLRMEAVSGLRQRPGDPSRVVLEWTLPDHADHALVYKAPAGTGLDAMRGTNPIDRAADRFVDTRPSPGTMTTYAIEAVYPPLPGSRASPRGPMTRIETMPASEPAPIGKVVGTGSSVPILHWPAPRSAQDTDTVLLFDRFPFRDGQERMIGRDQIPPSLAEVTPDRPGQATLGRAPFGPLQAAVCRRRGDICRLSLPTVIERPLPVPRDLRVDVHTFDISWTWPEDIDIAIVRIHSAATGRTEEQRVAREGAVAKGLMRPLREVAAGQWTVSAAFAQADRPKAVSTVREVSGTRRASQALSYRLEQKGGLLGFQKSVQLHLEGEAAGPLPAMTVVGNRIALPIGRQDAQTTVLLDDLTLEGQPPRQMVILSPADAQRLSGHYIALFCKEPADDTLLTLRTTQPSPQLKIR